MATRITLAEDRPDLVKEWHPERNGDLTPNDVSKSASIKVWWKCQKDPEHEWEAYISNRNKQGRRDGCPYCSGRYATPKTSLAYLNPELAEEWDYDKNSLTPDKVKPSSNTRAWWICKKDSRHRWDAVVGSRTSGNGCPCCSGKRAWEENNLLVHNPILASEWNYELNKKKPEEVLPYSNKKYWWTCSECGEDWEQSLNNRQRYGARGCNTCTSGQQTSFPEQAIFYYAQKLFPNVSIKNNVPLYFGDYEMTGDIYFPKHHILIEYDGEYAHKTKSDRDKRKNDLCKTHGIQLIRVVEPNITIHQDDYTIYIERTSSSGIKSLNDVLIQLFELLMDKLQLEANTEKIKEIIDLKQDFINIENTIKRVRKENSIAVTHPEICEEWNWEKNNGLKPEFFSYGSGKKVWWKCEHNHSYPMPISDKVKGRKCSVCARRLLIPEHSLAAEFPEIAKEWHPTLNGELTPKDIFSGYNQKVWWQCSVNPEHVWDATPNHRTSTRATGCPGCSNKAVYTSNSLAVKNPELAKEWHPTLNGELTPYDVTSGSDKVVWWLCSTCGHEWDVNIYHRNNGTGCPSKSCKSEKMRKKAKERYAKEGLEKLLNIAEERGGKLLDKEWQGMREDYNWKCKKGHVFSLKPRAIVERNKWCKECEKEKQ